MTRRAVQLRAAAAAALALLLAGYAAPAAPPPPKPVDADALRQRWSAAAQRHDYPAAEAALKELIQLTPTDDIARYNLVIIQLAQGQDRFGDAEQSLQEAINWGWTDLRRIRDDPALRPLRQTPTFRALTQRPRDVLDGILEGRLERYRAQYGPQYQVERDAPARVAFFSALSPGSLSESRAEVQRTMGWWQDQVLPQGTPAVSASDDDPDPWVVVILPSQRDYAAWALKNFGDRAKRIGGIYDFDRQELIAQDIGATLRHEFSHALHWRSMVRLGQRHPTWVMEGLCSLPEDVEAVPAAAPDQPAMLRPLPSWRTNTVKRMAQIGNLPKWSVLMGTDKRSSAAQSAFNGQRALGNCAVARSIFLYLAQKDRLRAWYEDYTRTYADDPTGAASIARVLGKPIEQVERDWKAWIKTLPEVAEVNRGLVGKGAVLPFDIEAGPDGLAVSRQALSVRDPRTGGLLDAPMTRAGLRFGDVILRIDGQTVRDLQELARFLGDKSPGDQVELVYRRGAAGPTYTTSIRLSP